MCHTRRCHQQRADFVPRFRSDRGLVAAGAAGKKTRLIFVRTFASVSIDNPKLKWANYGWGWGDGGGGGEGKCERKWVLLSFVC